MNTSSIVIYNLHFIEFKPIIDSLNIPEINIVYIVDHSNRVASLEKEINDVAGNYPNLEIVYIKHINNGYGGGHNIAIKRAISAGSKFHLVVNPDVWFPKETISGLIQYMNDNPDVGQAMPRILFPDGSIQRVAKLLPTPVDMFGRMCLPDFIIRKRNNRFELTNLDYSKVQDAPYLSGCFMFFKLEFLKEIGLFDERFFMYAEDIDVTRRMHSSHRTVLLPNYIAYHKFNRESRRSPKLFIIHIINIILYFNKWGWFFDPERNRINKQITNG